jgi:hypothetical protein
MARTWSHIIAGACLLIPGCLVSGCQIFDPGGQVRRGRLQEEWTVIDQAGLDHQGSGTKNVEYVYARGDVVMERDAEGTLTVSPDSSLTVFAHFKPKTDEGITESLAAAFAASTEQSKAMNETFSNITGMLIPLLQAKIPNPEPPTIEEDAEPQRLELLIDELRRRGIDIPEPDGD